MNKYQGRAMKYGDNINTDIISPPAAMELSMEKAAAYAMSPIDKEFAKHVQSGDIFVAENNLGSGSSRETAPLTLKILGIHCIIAKSYARIFYRNCINLGILALECQQTELISYDDLLEIDLENSIILNKTKQEQYVFNTIPKHIMSLIEIGGLYPYLEKRLEVN